MTDWSTLKKLIWLHMVTGSSGTVTTVTGASPLALANALAKPIKSLIQYGKVTTAGGELYCNNGKLTAVDDELPSGYKRLLGITFDGNFHYRTGEALTGDDNVTMTLNNLSASGKNVFGSYNGANDKNFSLYIYGSSTSGSYFRYGDQLKRPKYGGTGRRTITFGASGTSGFAEDSDVTPDEFTTPANTYIGMLPNSSSAAYTGDIVGSITVGTRLEWIPTERETDGVIGYYEKYNGNFIAPAGNGTPASLGYDTSHLTVLSVDGTPEVLTIGEQTASVANLFAVDDIKDEHNIISGTVTRRCEAVISDGTTPSGRYIGTVGEGNIIVKARETGYEGDVATFEADRAKPLNGLSVNVEPIQSGSGDPSPDNVRPISGRTSATIYHSGADTSNPTTYTIQLGDTVYGGQLDVTGGKMVVDRAMVDLGTMAWGYQSSPPQFYSNGIAETSINWHSWNDTPPLICSRYKPISNALLASSDFCIGYAYNSKQLRVNDSGFTDAASFKTAMSGVQLVYPLAQPIEITLTPTQIETLLGQNNVWSDAGTVKAYVADGDVIEHVAAQHLRTVEGTNTVTVTSAVTPMELSVTYTANA